MEKSCEDIREMLVDYADGQLLPSEANRVAEHLAKCEHCQRILDALQSSLELAEVVWEDGLGAAKEIRIPIPVKASNCSGHFACCNNFYRLAYTGETCKKRNKFC